MEFDHNPPSASAFKKLRDSAVWGDITVKQARGAVSGSLFWSCAYNDQSQLIAMARIIGDGALNVYIQDVIVSEQYRGEQIGKLLLHDLLEQIGAHCPKDITIGLLAAKGYEAFYSGFGFTVRPSSNFGAGMSASLSTIETKLE